MPCHVPSISRPPPTGIASGLGQRGLDVSRHVVRALGAMDEQGIAIRYQPLEKGDQVAPDVRIAFSWISSEADVCRQKTYARPVTMRDAATTSAVSFVNSIRPWPFVLSVNVR